MTGEYENKLRRKINQQTAEIERQHKAIKAKNCAIKALQQERDDREKYWRDWNGRAANRAALLEGEIQKLKTENNRLTVVESNLHAKIERLQKELEFAADALEDWGAYTDYDLKTKRRFLADLDRVRSAFD